jgi:hypothetical protein
MNNPWIKKNPYMSMWLSGANAVAGAARSLATAEANRQISAMVATGTRQMFDFWGVAWSGSPPRKRRKRSR